METESAEQFRTLSDLLGDALQGVVFGNGYLVVLIAAVFLIAVLLSRFLKGGSL